MEWQRPGEGIPAFAESGDEPDPHFQPGLSQLFRILGLDVNYTAARGASLFYEDQRGTTVEVIDFVGGYGALLLGHNHPELLREAQQFLVAQRPNLVQGAPRHGAEQLASELASRAGGDYCVVFGNSGAEAVEIAVKHALLETGGTSIIALESGFHGKTLAASHLSGNPDYRGSAVFDGLPVVRVPANNVAALQAAFDVTTKLAAMIFEPLQGEGGVRPLDSEFIKLARTKCQEHDIPLIADEIQTGMGRTGRFLACQHFDVAADYVLLSKSLGGGLAKISATLIARHRYRPEFDLKHSSTFAADGWSTTIARRVLQLVDDEAIARIAREGESRLEELRGLADRFPHIIAAVRGRGLMLGIEFQRRPGATNLLFRGLSCRDLLLPVIAAYLFQRHQIRIAPTLTDPFTLRVQASLATREEDWQKLFTALEDLCVVLDQEDAVELTAGVAVSKRRRSARSPLNVGKPWFAYDQGRLQIQMRSAVEKRVAWLGHLVDAEDMAGQDAAFRQLRDASREEYLDRLSPLASPFVTSSIPIRSITGETVQLIPIILPLTSQGIRGHLENQESAFCRQLVRNALTVARDLGCRLVSLGQYTSIATQNGGSLRNAPIGLTTGNAYAVVLANMALNRLFRQRGMDHAELRLAVVGAAGNIGSVVAQLMAPKFRETLLFGSERSATARRLRKVASRTIHGRVVNELETLQQADVVVAAVNSPLPLIESRHLAAGAIVCDISVPSAVSQSVIEERPDVTVIRGGIAQLPGAADLEIPEFPLPRGQTYACMAEAVLLGLDGITDKYFTGRLSVQHINQIQASAARHGFGLAESKTQCVLGVQPRVARHA